MLGNKCCGNLFGSNDGILFFMFNLFGGRSACEGESSTILWFIILVILLFMNNDDCCKNTCARNECGC